MNIPSLNDKIQLSDLEEQSIVRTAFEKTVLPSVCSFDCSGFSPLESVAAFFLFFRETGDGFRGYIKVAKSATIPHADMIKKSPW